MKMGSLPSLRLPESGFPSLIAQRPFNGEAPNMQAFSAASESSAHTFALSILHTSARMWRQSVLACHDMLQRLPLKLNRFVV